MSIEKRFVVKKDIKTDVITYMEYEKLKGLKFKPKSNVNFEDMISVNEMIVINPGLIEKLVSKKCSRNFKKILKLMSLVSDDDDDSGYMLILDEIERLKNLVINKYKNYMEEKEYDVLLKKLEIIKQEAEYRKNKISEMNLSYEDNKRGKSSR